MAVGIAGSQYYYRTANLPTATAFTMTCWVRITADWDSLVNPILAIGNNEGTGGPWYGLHYDGDPFNWRVWNGANSAAGSATGTAWIYAALTGQGTGTNNIKLYAGSSSTPDLQANGSASVNSPMEKFFIAFSRGSDPAIIEIAAVKIWSRVLDGTQIQAERLKAYPVDSANINGVYKLQVPETTDYSGLGNSLTANGTGFTTVSDPAGVDFNPPSAGNVPGMLVQGPVPQFNRSVFIIS